jgi:glycosyltransferase involved in cell wall biosynthesis
VKLLFVLPEYVRQNGGGIIAFYRALLPALVAQGHTVHVIVGSGASAESERNPFAVDGVTVESLENARLLSWLPRFSRYEMFPRLQAHLAAAWAIWEQVSGGNGFDVVEATDWGLLYVPWVVQIDGPPVVASMHGSMGQIATRDPVPGEEAMTALIRLIENEALRSAPVVQANSPMNAAFWEAELGRPVDMIYPACERAQPQEQTTPETRGQRALVVGRIQSWKGPETLCQALELLCPAAPDVDWVGRDTRQARLPSMSSVLERRYPEIWGKQVRALGSRAPAETAALQRAAAFVIIASDWDVFNMVCVEAMAMAAPVICSSGAGAHALIRDGENGLLFESGNAASLATAIRRMRSMTQEERAAMGALAVQTIHEQLAPAVVTALRFTSYQRTKDRKAANEYSRSAALRAVAAPQPDSGAGGSMEFLDTFSIRSLSRHLAARLGRKLTQRM